MAGKPPTKKMKKRRFVEVRKEDPTQKALHEIDVCQNHIDALDERASEEISRVEERFNILRRPHFEKRNLIIEQIPNFWINAFMNHPQLISVLDDEEEDCLQYLTKLEVFEFDEAKFGFKFPLSGYRIDFHFDPNPYFENNILSKEYHVGSPKPSSKRIPIRWKQDHDIYKSIVDRGMLEEGTDPITFFTWYEGNFDPSSDEIAEVIKDDLWLNPFQYYLVPEVDVGTIEIDDAMSDDEDGSVVFIEEINAAEKDEFDIYMNEYANEDDELEDYDEVHEVDEGVGDQGDETE